MLPLLRMDRFDVARPSSCRLLRPRAVFSGIDRAALPAEDRWWWARREVIAGPKVSSSYSGRGTGLGEGGEGDLTGDRGLGDELNEISRSGADVERKGSDSMSCFSFSSTSVSFSGSCSLSVSLHGCEPSPVADGLWRRVFFDVPFSDCVGRLCFDFSSLCCCGPSVVLLIRVGGIRSPPLA